MKKAILTALEVICDDPPAPYLNWTREALKKWLKQRGFNLDKPISQVYSVKKDAYIFTQREKK